MKSIPIELQDHREQFVTTTCRLLKIRCKDGSTKFGFANLDIDVEYDDLMQSGDSPPDGSILYRSTQGFTPSRLSTANGTSVDNAEMRGIAVSLESLGLTEEQVRAGILDFADAFVYEVNYNDLTAGRHDYVARGNCGKVSSQDEQFTAEFRSLMQRFKQPIGEVTSVTCRAKFGDERCQKPWEWVNGTVSAVDIDEPGRIFTVASFAQATNYFRPGVVQVLDGQNEGAELEVDSFSGGEFVLGSEFYYPLTPGTAIRARQDCSKDPDDDEHGCLYHWGSERTIHFVGEPKLPLGQEGEISTPGAQL